MTKPIVFNVVKAQERIAELEKENAHLRGEIKGAKILIWQQKNLVRCRDCKHKVVTEDGEYNPEDIVCDYWMSDGLDSADFCSYGERIEEFNARPSAKYITEKPNDAVKASNDLINRSDAIDAVHEYFKDRMGKSKCDYDEELQVYVISKEERTMLTYNKGINDKLRLLPSADAEQTDCTDFVNWLTEVVMDEGNWELNAVAYGEIICRKLEKLGVLEVTEEPSYYIRPSADAVQEAVPTVVRVTMSDGSQYYLEHERDAIQADAVQGEWVCKEREYNDCDGHYAHYWYECSVCGARPPKDTWKNEWHSNYCPSCGARMKGGDTE